MEDQISQKLDAFFNNFTPVKEESGFILIHAEESPTGVFYLKKGLVRQYVISPKGEEITLNIFRPKAFFPLMWAINGTPNKYYFEAISEIEGWRAPAEEVVTMIKNNPDVMYDLLARLYKGVDGLLGRMTNLMVGNARAKVIFTIMNMHDRFNKNAEQAIPFESTHKDLASISGVTRETFSREIKKLEEEGLLKMEKGNITILQLAGLEKALYIS